MTQQGITDSQMEPTNVITEIQISTMILHPPSSSALRKKCSGNFSEEIHSLTCLTSILDITLHRGTIFTTIVIVIMVVRYNPFLHLSVLVVGWALIWMVLGSQTISITGRRVLMPGISRRPLPPHGSLMGRRLSRKSKSSKTKT